MRFNHLKTVLKTATLAVIVLLLGVGLCAAQQAVNLMAGPATATLPDGSTVPMWGYSCGAAVPGSAATCAALKAGAGAGVWSPVVITIPTGKDLAINLTNNLIFQNGTAKPNNVPTSIVIVGQLGGGLGSAATYAPSPTHAIQGTTWPIAGDTSGATFNPPKQGQRVQSFATEVAANSTASLCWGPTCSTPSPALRPGTYLLESGTHPSIQGPMGLYGILVVTTAPSNGTGTAYPNVSYGADLPLIFSEIDPNQNKAVMAAVSAVGFSETAARVLRDTVSSVTLAVDNAGNVINAGSGYSVGDPVTIGGGGYSVQATAQVATLGPNGAIATVTVINPGQGYSSVPTATAGGTGTGAQLTANLSLSGVMCSDGATACYPPAVNYTPLYYLINGQAFDKTSPGNSLFAAVGGLDTSNNPITTGITNPVLVRMVNAGLRMHIPSIVGAQTGSAASGFSLIAEDGNPLPGVPRVQSEVFMPAGKTYDVLINAPQANGAVPPIALPIFDRELSLSGNAIARDAGMLAYIGVNGATLPVAPAAAQANPDTYNSVIAGKVLSITDPSKGVISNDLNVFGVTAATQPTHGNVVLNSDGTFSYTPDGSWTGTTPTVTDSFVYCGNNFTYVPPATLPHACAMVTLGTAPVEAASGIHAKNITYTASTSTYINIPAPGVLSVDSDDAGYPLNVAISSVQAQSGLTLTMEPNGGFIAQVSGAGTYTFTYQAQNSQGTLSDPQQLATVTLVFPAAANLKVSVVDGVSKAPIADYRWIIEEDRTFYTDPKCTTNPPPSGCPTGSPTLGTNFHTSFMPMVATGCTGPQSCESGQTVSGHAAACDAGNGICDTTRSAETAVTPDKVVACSSTVTTGCLDPTKRYYISVLPGDAANPFNAAYGGTPDCSQAGAAAGQCGHTMGGAPIAAGQTSVTVLSEPTPLKPAKLSVFVFEDDAPLNGEQDAGGGVDVLSPNEPGLGGFQITLFDDAGGTGDATGQPTYDMFNMPLSNSLAGTIDPANGNDACPISKNATTGFDGTVGTQGITGMIVTCPTYESDGKTLSPLAGQAVVANLYPGRYGVVANPAADRIARGEEWLQTNTLDGQKAHDSFMRVGEPGYFQEFGPAGYHVSIGFASPKIINSRYAGVCAAIGNCTNTVKGQVTAVHNARTPDERIYGSGSRDSLSFTQCYISLGDPDGEDFMFTKCDDQGNFSFANVPPGDWKVAIFDQWNDQIVDGIATPVRVCGPNQPNCVSTADMKQIAVNQWQADIYTTTFFDQNFNGVRDGNEEGLALVPTNIRFRDGSYSNFNSTDLNGYAGFNEVFPLFAWYVIETDSTRYKNTGTHVVYDAGGPADGTSDCNPANNAPCGLANQNSPYNFFANTYEKFPVPANLHVPGSVYCAEATCSKESIATGPNSATPNSTARIDAGWVNSYGWQGFAGQNSFLEFGKKPFSVGENGGIHGHVVYASTRPFDDPQLLLQLSWEPLVPHVTINLYREGTAPDGTKSLTLVDHTQTSSFDDWAQGFHADPTNPSALVPNMSCPGQDKGDIFFYSMKDEPNYLDWYNSQHGGPAATPLPYNSQFKCYDGMHNWNQLQPAPYDGMYSFPSVTSMDPLSGKPTGTNCTICIPNPSNGTDNTSPDYDPYRAGQPMLPAGKYVVEVVVPPGYELVKEEDKNILIGDNYIAPVTQQFAGLGNIFILPDQAEVTSLYNANNAQNPTQNLGRVQDLPSHEGDTGSVESFWPCVGQARVVPDYISLFPGSAEVSPFAGATRNLCDRKEVTLTDQTAALAKFYIFTSTHIASHFTGIITDDLTSEFDPFSPQFGEKFAPSYLPVAIKDFNGNEINRVYSDAFGAYNGLNYSTWEVNPPNPTGYAPTMMVTCMNDAGTGATPDPLFQPGYSQFCYELPFMPGQTGYFDTPVVSISAFQDGYNHPDCNYPDATPAVSEVDGDSVGPWVSATGPLQITIKALGDQKVENYAYTGPSATVSPFNQQKVTRHYGFGATQGTGSVTIGGVPATITSWSDTQILATVKTNGTVNGQPVTMPACAVQQQAIYNGSPAKCGQLVITAGNGKQSIDSITVTVGGKQPTVLGSGQTIQSAIDGASPGDMIIVPPGKYSELLLMWKPVRLQGVGAASSVIDANPHPAGKLDPWRREVGCLFGLAMNGQPSTGNVTVQNGQVVAGSGGSNPYDASGTYACPWAGVDKNAVLPTFSGGPNYPTMVVDRIPMEGILGWDTTVNGNLAEQLIEPGLMGAYEGAAITVLAKGVNIPTGATDIFGSGAEAAFPAGSVPLTAADCLNSAGNNNPYPTNFACNPSSIDGLGISNSSQGGGGIFVHGWGHNIQIANNRVYNNTGTLAGGITIGQGEHVDLQLVGDTNIIPPGSCESGTVSGQGLPYCYNLYVNVHNNSITLNSSIGDELFSSTPAGAGGVAFCNGADYYKFNYNWVCGNLSSGDGAGFSHIGFIKNGDVEHNSILFNQSTNPTIPTYGGGLLVMGAPDPDPACGSVTDKDCVPAVGEVPPSDGTGPGLTINANLIQGNAAESGSGGGIRLQHVNGTDVMNLPSTSSSWNKVTITNNVIVNNVAGWDGGGVSLQDALNVDLVNNTIMNNDATASSGVLFNTLFAPLSSSPGTNCINPSNSSQSCPQIAGVASTQNSANLVANLATVAGITCPAGHSSAPGANDCTKASFPLLANNILWQNRSFFIAVTSLGTAPNMQNEVALYNPGFSGNAATLAGSQSSTGDCPSGAAYWDIGVRGDLAPGDHSSGFTLAPIYSVLTNTGNLSENGYGSHNFIGTNPSVTSQYCNGSRVPPEAGGMGYTVSPGTNESNAPIPLFNLQPNATVDEGNNWISMRWGPLSLTNQDVTTSSYGTLMGNYMLQTTSPVIDAVPTNSPTYALAPSTDFFGNPRPDVKGTQIDVGAIEAAGSLYPNASVSPASLAFGNVFVGLTSAPQTVTLSNTGDAVLNVGTITATAPFALAPGGTCTNNGTVGINSSCTINVAFKPTVAGPANGILTIAGMNDPANQSLSVALSGTGVVPPIGSVNPTSLAFGGQAISVPSPTRTVTLSNTGGTTLTINSISITGPIPSQFARTNAVANNCGGSVIPGSSCNIGITFTPTTMGAKTATLVIATNDPFNGNPVGTFNVGLSGTGAAMSINPWPLAFGNQPVGTTSAAQTLTLSNRTGATRTYTVAVTAPFARAAGANGGTCTGSLANGANCTINVVFSPTVLGNFNGSVTVTLTAPTGGNVVANSPVALSGTGVAAPSKPVLPVLDDFNRGNTTTLGANWRQVVALGVAALQVNNNQVFCNNTGALGLPCMTGGWALWNAANNNLFGARQAAAFTFANAPSSNTVTPALILKSTGSTNALGLQTNFIRVLYQAGGGGSIQIATTTNSGGSFTTVGTIAGSFANGDTVTAFVDGTGTVFVWKTTAANVTTLLGGVTLPANANNLWTTGGGSIGMALAPGGRGDNFAGATVP